jgi:hypothetical protein
MRTTEATIHAWHHIALRPAPHPNPLPAGEREQIQKPGQNPEERA